MSNFQTACGHCGSTKVKSSKREGGTLIFMCESCGEPTEIADSGSINNLNIQDESFKKKVEDCEARLNDSISKDKKPLIFATLKKWGLWVGVVAVVVAFGIGIIGLGQTISEAVNDSPTSENSMGGNGDTTVNNEGIIIDDNHGTIIINPENSETTNPSHDVPAASIKYTIHTTSQGDKYAVVTGCDETLEKAVIVSEYEDKESGEVVPVTEIAAGAFRGNGTLTDVSIPSSVLKIGDNAFSACEKLKRVLIPRTVMEIGKSVFFGCIGLKIDYQGTIKDWETIGIHGDNGDLSEAKLYCNSVDITCDHNFEKRVNSDKYKASGASCTALAKYYLSCECGASGVETFECGDVSHTFNQRVEDERYFKEVIGEKNIYFYSCICGEIGVQTFEVLKDNVQHITTTRELYTCLTESENGGFYVLDKDLDFSGSVWLPIENFKGVLDGRGHKIKNLSIQSVGNLSDSIVHTGFIQVNAGTIQNIIFDNVTVTVNYEYDSSSERRLRGGIVGFNNGRISNIRVMNSNFDVAIIEENSAAGHDVNPVLDLGAIAGWNCGEIEYCKVENTTLKGYSNAKANYGQTYSVVGGFVGTNRGNILNSISTGLTISSEARGGYYKFLTGGGWVKSWVGYITGNNERNVQNCVSYGHVELNSKANAVANYMGIQNYRGLASGKDSGTFDKVFVTSMDGVDNFIGSSNKLYQDNIKSDKNQIYEIIGLWPNWSYKNEEFDVKPENSNVNIEIQEGKTNFLNEIKFPEERIVFDNYGDYYLYGAGCLATGNILEVDISKLDLEYIKKTGKNLEIVIEISIKEEYDGYQEIYLYNSGVSAKDVQNGNEDILASVKMTHTDGKKDGVYARYRLTAVINPYCILSNQLWITFDSNGDDEDTWKFKQVTVSIGEIDSITHNMYMEKI